MPRHAIFKIGSSLLFHCSLFLMVQHVVLYPAGMYQRRGQTKKLVKKRKKSIGKPCNTFFGDSMSLCVPVRSYRSFRELCQSGSPCVECYKLLWSDPSSRQRYGVRRAIIFEVGRRDFANHQINNL